MLSVEVWMLGMEAGKASRKRATTLGRGFTTSGTKLHITTWADRKLLMVLIEGGKMILSQAIEKFGVRYSNYSGMGFVAL